ncbi:hypothetical protein [Pedobacter namyangjuensis]|uniref:hypothetical protein n=1 Tax=Pedobacter namyangjuensis TaxID=600626 RepID=UPI000DE4648E|nr:hypothetical protein [Pedobacter namyangjuensis]
MNKSVLIIKGYSKTDVELINDRKIIQLYIDFFTSNAGGCFDFDTDFVILEEPELEELKTIDFLNAKDYLIVLLVGHGANKDGIQIFQLNKDVLIQPGQLQFDCERQLHIIETCRNIIDFELDIKRINRLIPKYKYGGVVKRPLTREEALLKFNEALSKSAKETVYIFACNIDESAYSYFFLQVLVDISIYIHEYYRNSIYNISEIFEHVEKQVNNLSKGDQNPIKIGDGNFPFVVTII